MIFYKEITDKFCILYLLEIAGNSLLNSPNNEIQHKIHVIDTNVKLEQMSKRVCIVTILCIRFLPFQRMKKTKSRTSNLHSSLNNLYLDDLDDSF